MDDSGEGGIVKLEDFRERKEGFVDEWMKNEKGEEDEINEEVVLCIVILGWMNGRVKSNLGVFLYTFPLRKIDDVSIDWWFKVTTSYFVFLQMHHGILYFFRHLLTKLFSIIYIHDLWYHYYVNYILLIRWKRQISNFS